MEQRQGGARGLALWGAVLLGAGLVVLLAGWAIGGGCCAGGMMQPGGMMPPFGQGGFVNPFWGVLNLLAWPLVIGGLVLLGIWLVRALRPGTGASTAEGQDDPDRIAELRYARGEISREEYENIRQHLTRSA